MNNKIRVLHMFLGNSKGGRTQYMLNTWEYINRDKFHFDFLTLCDSLDYEEDLIQSGSKVFHISCYAEENPQQFRQEIIEAMRNHYDAIHVHFSFWRGFHVEECAKIVGIQKIILHSHNNGISMVADEKEALKLEKEHLRLREKIDSSLATHFLACSQIAADWMFSDKIDREKIKIIKNGIRLNRYRYNEDIRQKKREELALNSKYIIGCIAKFNYQKNHDFLIDVFASVAKSISDAVLVLVGVGELQQVIEEKVKMLDLSERVFFLGKRNDVPELLQAMDLFVLPSRFDGFPLSLIEAQAASLPCVVGNVPKESCFTDRTYRLPFDVDTWKDVIFHENSDVRRCYVPEIILDEYDINSQVRALEKIYEE